MAVRFSRPDAGDDVPKLSECAYIRFEIVDSGLSENGDIYADVYVFEFRVEEGGELIQTPKLPIPVVLK